MVIIKQVVVDEITVIATVVVVVVMLISGKRYEMEVVEVQQTGSSF